MKSKFDKYDLYTRAVQSPETDVEFLYKTYRSLRKKNPSRLREDFCGTFALSCAWVKYRPNNYAIGLDLDEEPIEYGRKNHLLKLKPAEQNRIEIHKANVMSGTAAPVDIVAAMNFSYYIFKSRIVLKTYFKRVLRGLKKDGLLILDCFGGALCQEVNVDRRKVDAFTYYWDQASYNPITHEAQFYIHFKRPGHPQDRKVFSYDWRMWTIAELRDLLAEVGFKRTTVYWEGTDRKGEGNGVFRKSEKGDDSSAWVAYIAAET